MKILILGWYGTETLGDRAILAGLAHIFQNAFGSFSVKIGSLYPFLTRRTLHEDAIVLRELAPGGRIDFFDVRNKAQLKEVIVNSTLVVMGGGPIMDLVELEVVSWGFRYAKKQGKKTAVLGCGLGPLHNRQFIAVAADIFAHSDCIVFRDKRSLEKFSTTNLLRGDRTDKACYCHDPAILPVGKYLSRDYRQGNYLAVNFRRFPGDCFEVGIQFADTFFSKMLVDVSKMYDCVRLVPMHTFYVGGDDRCYLSELMISSNVDNVRVLHKPLNLFELFDQYRCAAACIGMRYHSVVFQTLLNGNNFIFDYTEQGGGKINSFLEILNAQTFYQGRYLNLQTGCSDSSEIAIREKVISVLKEGTRFPVDEVIYEETLSVFVEEILRLC